ncbi:PIN domain-containing protein [Nocardia terpenica]|uniref:PIN domain-containing protein n=1 Tax=Nocardia terpenica TaxID=455432 RepID=A0A291RG91_9NOCA|nr:PIN domain-containing protein [Nocardia terpenica]ATL66320.1 PIN domain-containing protein [Nocardia terpenica]
MFTAVLDTCVLWPSLQRDFLLSLAVEAMYRPLWSRPILDELEYHEAAKLVDRGLDRATADARASRLVEQMRTVFEDALVKNWEPHEGTFGLPDPDDEHVVAAAMVGGAGAIVTDNIKDFPRMKVPQHILILTPAAFAADTVATNPEAAAHALATISTRFRNPARTMDELLTILEERYSMIEAVELLRNV